MEWIFFRFQFYVKHISVNSQGKEKNWTKNLLNIAEFSFPYVLQLWVHSEFSHVKLFTHFMKYDDCGTKKYVHIEYEFHFTS